MNHLWGSQDNARQRQRLLPSAATGASFRPAPEIKRIMNLRLFATAALLGFAITLPAQQTTDQNGAVGTNTTTAHPAATASSSKAPRVPKAPMQQAPGGGPDQVWVNTNSSVYHCPGDRFYGKTAHGRYMTEAAAKSAGAKGVGGKTCFAGK